MSQRTGTRRTRASAGPGAATPQAPSSSTRRRRRSRADAGGEVSPPPSAASREGASARARRSARRFSREEQPLNPSHGYGTRHHDAMAQAAVGLTAIQGVGRFWRRLKEFRSARSGDAAASGADADLDDDGQQDFNDGDVTDNEVEGSDGPPVVASDLESGDELISDVEGGGDGDADEQGGPDCEDAAPLSVDRTLTPLGRFAAVLLILLIAFAVVRVVGRLWSPATEPAVDAGAAAAAEAAVAARPLAAIARPVLQRTVNAVLLPVVGVRATGRAAAYVAGFTLRGIAHAAVLLGRAFLTTGGAVISLPRLLASAWPAGNHPAAAGSEAASAASVWELEDRVSRLAEACAKQEAVEEAMSTAAAAKRLASEAQERAAEEALHQAVTRAVAEAEDRLRASRAEAGDGMAAEAAKAAVRGMEERLEALRARVSALEGAGAAGEGAGAAGEGEEQAAATEAAEAAISAAKRAEAAQVHAVQASHAAERASEAASVRAEGVEAAVSRAESAATDAAASAGAAAEAAKAVEAASAVPADAAVTEALGRGEATEAVNKAIERYAADKVGRVDYAAVMGGAQVVTALTSATYSSEPDLVRSLLEAARIVRNTRGPQWALKEPSSLGMCWPMVGRSGTLTVRLASPTRVDAVSIEHYPAAANPHRKTAPKTFSLWALASVDDASPAAVAPARGVAFRYDVHAGRHVQTFAVQEPSEPVSVLQLRVEDNWGEERYTCLYRFRVHGTPAK